jgi:DNA-binding CsgD family transcriptional regulator
MAITHPDDLQQDLDNMQRLMDGAVREFSMEKRYIHNDGSLVWGNLTVAALWDVGEEPDYHLAIVEDITARKRAEEQLKQTNDLLEQRVQERTVELQGKAQELTATNELLKERELELSEKNQNLQELNTALKVLIQKKDEFQTELGDTLQANINAAIEPSLDKLAQICLDDRQQKFIEIIKMHLQDIIAPFTRNLKGRYSNLSQSEIKVADLIKHGFSSKKIAEHLNISSETVAFHRKNLRKKLGITNSKESLVSFLQQI